MTRARTALDEYEATMMTRFNLRRSRAPVCPRVVAGRRCLDSFPRECECHRFHRVLDHAAMWLDGGGNHVLTSEPYELPSRLEELATLQARIADLDLTIEVTPWSYWCKGTTLIVIRRAATQAWTSMYPEPAWLRGMHDAR